jgi:hypothetical protein
MMIIFEKALQQIFDNAFPSFWSEILAAHREPIQSSYGKLTYNVFTQFS